METFANMIALIMAIISVSSIIAAVTPTPKDDIWIGKLYKILIYVLLTLERPNKNQEINNGLWIIRLV